jgi:hypothetical protein
MLLDFASFFLFPLNVCIFFSFYLLLFAFSKVGGFCLSV